MTTEEAFQRIKRGDEKAFELIYKEYFSRLCLLSKKIVGDPVIAEDIVQQLFFTLWNNRSKITIDTTGGGYLARSTYNLTLQYIRKNSIHSKHHALIYDDLHAGSGYYDQQMEYASDDEKIFKLRKALQLLPEQCRAIIIKSRYENKKSAEIASEMNLSVRTVENQLYIGLKKLKDHLSKESYFGIIIVTYILLRSCFNF
ncbi:MAG: RNA polymerase sigma-70 factor [Rikenellaceae bacterium]